MTKYWAHLDYEFEDYDTQYLLLAFKEASELLANNRISALYPMIESIKAICVIELTEREIITCEYDALSLADEVDPTSLEAKGYQRIDELLEKIKGVE